MVLVDTSVWVDFFADRPLPHVATLQQVLLDDGDICVCGVVLTEVLQGIRQDKDYRVVSARFDDFIFLPMHRSAFVRAAEMFRALRKRGATVRKPVDCMIAAVAIEHDIPLLHNDRDFDLIAAHCGLKVVKV